MLIRTARKTQRKHISTGKTNERTHTKHTTTHRILHVTQTSPYVSDNPLFPPSSTLCLKNLFGTLFGCCSSGIANSGLLLFALLAGRRKVLATRVGRRVLVGVEIVIVLAGEVEDRTRHDALLQVMTDLEIVLQAILI